MRTGKFASEIYSPLVAPWQSWIFCFWLSLPKLHYWPPSWIHSITPLSRGIVRTLLSAIYSLLLHFGPFCEARVSEEIATVNSGSEILGALCQKNVKYWFVLSCTIYRSRALNSHGSSLAPRTTDTWWGNRLHNMDENQLPTPNPKFLDTVEAYYVCHIGPNFQGFFDFCLHWVSVVCVPDLEFIPNKILQGEIFSQISFKPTYAQR